MWFGGLDQWKSWAPDYNLFLPIWSSWGESPPLASALVLQEYGLQNLLITRKIFLQISKHCKKFKPRNLHKLPSFNGRTTWLNSTLANTADLQILKSWLNSPNLWWSPIFCLAEPPYTSPHQCTNPYHTFRKSSASQLSSTRRPKCLLRRPRRSTAWRRRSWTPGTTDWRGSAFVSCWNCSHSNILVTWYLTCSWNWEYIYCLTRL